MENKVIDKFEEYCNLLDEGCPVILLTALKLLKEQETMVQCIKGKCRICPHCANCDVDENGLLKE